MFSIERCPLPDNALLNKYDYPGVYTDCYRTDVIGAVTLEEYVDTFYTTLLFKLERIILKWAASKPSSDIQAIQLADGNTDTFRTKAEIGAIRICCIKKTNMDR